MKKFLSLLMVVVLVLCSSVTAFAKESEVAQLEAIESYETGHLGTLIDSIYIAVDRDGNVQQVNPLERSWFSDHTIHKFNFYDMGITSDRHYYEVEMSSVIDDPDCFFTYHEMSIRPKGNTDWWTHQIKHSIIDCKTSIGDGMSYSYVVGQEPSNPTGEVKAKYSIYGYGTFSLSKFTLEDPKE